MVMLGDIAPISSKIDEDNYTYTFCNDGEVYYTGQDTGGYWSHYEDYYMVHDPDILYFNLNNNEQGTETLTGYNRAFLPRSLSWDADLYDIYGNGNFTDVCNPCHYTSTTCGDSVAELYHSTKNPAYDGKKRWGECSNGDPDFVEAAKLCCADEKRFAWHSNENIDSVGYNDADPPIYENNMCCTIDDLRNVIKSKYPTSGNTGQTVEDFSIATDANNFINACTICDSPEVFTQNENYKPCCNMRLRQGKEFGEAIYYCFNNGDDDVKAACCKEWANKGSNFSSYPEDDNIRYNCCDLLKKRGETAYRGFYARSDTYPDGCNWPN